MPSPHRAWLANERGWTSASWRGDDPEENGQASPMRLCTVTQARGWAGAFRLQRPTNIGWMLTFRGCFTPERALTTDRILLISTSALGVRTQDFHVVDSLENIRAGRRAVAHAAAHLADRFVLVFFHPPSEISEHEGGVLYPVPQKR